MKLKEQGLFRSQCFVDGEWIDSADKKTIKVYNPATGELVGEVPSLGREETGRAIAAHSQRHQMRRSNCR